MAADWQELTKLTAGEPMVVERVRLPDKGVAIEGEFILPPLAQLPAEDQVFVMAFVRAHGSIKEMERTFGISYPTVKNRLNRISGGFNLVEISAAPTEPEVVLSDLARSEVLAQLERGEITADEAIERLSS
jgi:hypothetical protein